MSRAEEVVRDFCQAFSRCDVGELIGFFAEDAIYHNIPLPAVRGKAAIEATLRQFVDPNGSAEFEIKALACTAGTVLTERVDRFVVNGKRVELPVMGAFEVGPDGRIRAWRDYFDMAQFTKQLAPDPPPPEPLPPEPLPPAPDPLPPAPESSAPAELDAPGPPTELDTQPAADERSPTS